MFDDENKCYENERKVSSDRRKHRVFQHDELHLSLRNGSIGFGVRIFLKHCFEGMSKREPLVRVSENRLCSIFL